MPDMSRGVAEATQDCHEGPDKMARRERLGMGKQAKIILFLGRQFLLFPQVVVRRRTVIGGHRGHVSV